MIEQPVLRRPYELLSDGANANAEELLAARDRILDAYEHASARDVGAWLAIYAGREDPENARDLQQTAITDWRSVINDPTSARGDPEILQLNARKNCLLADVLINPLKEPSPGQRLHVARGLGAIAQRTLRLLRAEKDPEKFDKLKGNFTETAYLQLLWPLAGEEVDTAIWAGPASPGQDHSKEAGTSSDIIVYGSSLLFKKQPVPIQIKTSARYVLTRQAYEKNKVPVCIADDLVTEKTDHTGHEKVLYLSQLCYGEAMGVPLTPEQRANLKESRELIYDKAKELHAKKAARLQRAQNLPVVRLATIAA